MRLKDALEETLSLTREVNAWLNEREPWKTLKTDPADAARSVYAALRCIDNLKLLFAPFVPFSSQQVHEMLGYEGQLFGELEIENYSEDTRDHLALVYDGSKAVGLVGEERVAVGAEAARAESAVCEAGCGDRRAGEGVSGAGAGGESGCLTNWPQ